MVIAFVWGYFQVFKKINKIKSYASNSYWLRPTSHPQPNGPLNIDLCSPFANITPTINLAKLKLDFNLPFCRAYNAFILNLLFSSKIIKVIIKFLMKIFIKIKLEIKKSKFFFQLNIMHLTCCYTDSFLIWSLQLQQLDIKISDLHFENTK